MNQITSPETFTPVASPAQGLNSHKAAAAIVARASTRVRLRSRLRASYRLSRCRASSAALPMPQSATRSESFAEHDLFLIAGAGIAGLAMAAALTKVFSALMKTRTCSSAAPAMSAGKEHGTRGAGWHSLQSSGKGYRAKEGGQRYWLMAQRIPCT